MSPTARKVPEDPYVFDDAVRSKLAKVDESRHREITRSAKTVMKRPTGSLFQAKVIDFT